MFGYDEIFEKVSATLVDSLNVEQEEIKPTSTLQDDLGAESIDFLDIVFRLEREFGIKIPRNELFPESIFQGDPDFVEGNKVSAKGLCELRERMPFADIAKFEKNPDLTNISDLFTVDMITRYIHWKLGDERLREALQYNHGIVVAVAETIVFHRRFTEMPVLADALEEAGCIDEKILAHCRLPGQIHAEYCWVLQAILKKK